MSDSQEKKRIIICADGTWNEPERKDEKTGKMLPTNVLKVARAVLPRDKNGVDQVVYYHVGVGTGGPLDRLTGGAFGTGMAQNVRSLYRFIVYNWVPGDELYFFGFSRGAFTVRTLAGFMVKVGLLEKDDEYYVPKIYGLYESNAQPGSEEWTEAFKNIRGTRPCPTIRFIGVWDTVGALGAPGFLGQVFNKKKYQYHDIGLHVEIENAYHALAIDERRKPFAPSLWKRPQGWTGNLEQAWFPGVHSNVGGGYRPDGLANEALHWIVEKAEALGLKFDEEFLGHYLPCFNSTLNDSMSMMYRIMGPIDREVAAHPEDGEVVHQAALDRLGMKELGYGPDSLRAAIGRTARTVNTARILRGKPC